MAGTREGGDKAAATNKLRYGEDFYSKIGRKGGQETSKKGFWGRSQVARMAARKSLEMRRQKAELWGVAINSKEYSEHVKQSADSY